MLKIWAKCLILHPGAWESISQLICYWYFWKHPQGKPPAIPNVFSCPDKGRDSSNWVNGWPCHWVMASCLRKELLAFDSGPVWEEAHWSGWWARSDKVRSPSIPCPPPELQNVVDIYAQKGGKKQNISVFVMWTHWIEWWVFALEQTCKRFHNSAPPFDWLLLIFPPRLQFSKWPTNIYRVFFSHWYPP